MKQLIKTLKMNNCIRISAIHPTFKTLFLSPILRKVNLSRLHLEFSAFLANLSTIPNRRRGARADWPAPVTPTNRVAMTRRGYTYAAFVHSAFIFPSTLQLQPVHVPLCIFLSHRFSTRRRHARGIPEQEVQARREHQFRWVHEGFGWVSLQLPVFLFFFPRNRGGGKSKMADEMGSIFVRNRQKNCRNLNVQKCVQFLKFMKLWLFRSICWFMGQQLFAG